MAKKASGVESSEEIALASVRDNCDGQASVWTLIVVVVAMGWQR